MRRRFLVIHNSLAGVTRRRMVERTCEALAARGALVTLQHASSLAEDEQLAREAASAGQVDAVVAAGGDSTVRGVAAGVAGTPVPLGIIPAGTGNVLAEEIGLKRDPEAAAQCLAHGDVRDVTGGALNGVTFYEMAGIGYDARVLERLRIGLKQRVGKAAYAWPVLAELVRPQPRFTITLDGRQMACTWAILAKASHYAGGFVLSHERALTDPGFLAVIVNAASRGALLGVLTALAANRIGAHPPVKLVPCATARIAGGAALAVQIDGEPLAMDRGKGISIGPSAMTLRLIVPPA